MKILTDEDGNKYKVVTIGMQQANNKTQMVVEEIPEQNIFPWDGVANKVLVDSFLSIASFLFDKHQHIHVERFRLSSEWNVWRGGECPLPEGVLIKVELRGDLESPRYGLADSFIWNHDNGPQDIISYQVDDLEEGTIYQDQVEK